MYIGNIKIKNKAALAPMAGVTDKAFREICENFGVAYFTSEMVSAKGLIYDSKKTFELIDHSPSATPFAIQLFGNCPEDFKKAIPLLLNSSANVVDINMGCPATKIVKENSGSALMKTPELCGEIVYAAKQVSPFPVTVKIRAGWDSSNLNAPEVAKICEQAGADAITIHGRTSRQGYSGKCDLNVIKHVKETISIPIIGNGDIVDAKSAYEMIEFTKCDMVAVGRGAMGNPWIFEEINHLFSSTNPFSPPTLNDKVKIMKQHIEKICNYKGELRGVKEARKHLASYIKDFPGAAQFRKNAFNTENKQELLEICNNITNSSYHIHEITGETIPN